MARKAALALCLLGLATAAAGTAGCVTWAESRHDYPPSMFQQGGGHVHGQPPVPGGF